MKNKFLSLLVAVMCVLATCADVDPVKDFNLEKMAGKWYMVGIATNAEWFTKNKGEMKIGTAVFAPTAEGDLQLSYARLLDDGNCLRYNHLANKTDTPGRFVYDSKVWNNHNDMRVVHVLYDDYAMIYTNKTRDAVSLATSELLSRTPEAGVVLQQNFTQFSKDNGILPENIVLLAKNSECPEEPTAAP